MSRLPLSAGFLAFGLGILAVPPAFAQTIAGVITDPTGAVISGADVDASSPALIEGHRTVTTNEAGRYTFVNLVPGTYTVSVKKEGFSSANRGGVVLTTGFTAEVDLQLTIGQLTNTVAIEAEAPAVDTQSTTLNQVVTTNNMEALPTGRSISDFLNLIPGGGTLNFGAPAYRGNTDAQTMVDGARTSVLIGAGPGLTSHLTSNSAYQEMSFSNGMDNLDMQTPGMLSRIIPKEGGNQFHGALFATYTRDSFSGNNVPASLAGPPANLLASVPLKLWDFNPTVGGPIIKNKLWFQATFQVDSNNYAVPRSPANALSPGLAFAPGGQVNNPTKSYDGTGNLTWQADTKDKFSFFFDQTSTDAPFTREPSFTFFGLNNTGSATNDLDTYSKQFIIRWTRIMTPRLLIEGTFSIYNDVIANDLLGPYHNWEARFNTDASLPRPAVSALEVGNYGLGYIYNNVLSDYTQSNTWTLAHSASYVTGSHQFKIGYQFLRGQNIYRSRFPGDAYITSFGPAFTEVTEYLPTNTINKIGADLGVYVQDKWTIKRLTVNYGIRFDYLRTNVPNESLIPTAFLPAENFNGVNVLNWKDLSPRFGLAYDVFPNHKTVVRAGVARFVAGQTTAITNANNPDSLIQGTATYLLNPGFSTVYNSDGTLNKAALGAPQGNNANFGTLNQTTFYNPSVLRGFDKRGYTWDIEGGVSQQVLPRTSVAGTFYYMWQGNLTATLNDALSPGDYNPFCATAPADPALPGGGGYQVCGLYNLNPAYLSVPTHNDVVFANSIGNHKGILNVTNGFQLNTQGTFGKGGFVTGGFEYRRILYDNCGTLVINPQTLYCRSVTPYLPNFRLSVGYVFPFKIAAAGIFHGNKTSGALFAATQTGIAATWSAPYTATTLGRPCTGGTGAGSCSVPLVNPYVNYLPVWTQFDMRFSRPFTLRERLRFTPELDFLNIFNQAGISSVNTTYTAPAVLATQGPNALPWQYPTGIGPEPRQFRISLQMNF
ncbi:MAG: TonB-dependent receptor [Acidobacteriia bacterium]|nr:TonB-dependent receptor [Terriglobia bacterium]